MVSRVTPPVSKSTVTLETIEQKVADEGYAVAGHHVFGA